jgi:hypothetical protein
MRMEPAAYEIPTAINASRTLVSLGANMKVAPPATAVKMRLVDIGFDNENILQLR